MNIARPKDGFYIGLAEPVRSLIHSKIEQNPAFERYWDNIVERLKFTAHIEGKPIPSYGNGHLMRAFAADDFNGIPRTVVVYVVTGDRVRIRVLGP